MEKTKERIEEEKMIPKKEWQELKKKEKLVNGALKVLKVEEKDLPRTVERFQREIKEMEEKLKK